VDSRRPLRWLRAWSFEKLGGRARTAGRLDGSRAAILMYHRVIPRAEVRRRNVEPGMYVTPETFARHLAWLKSDFAVLPLAEIVERLLARRSLPRGACAITFDDGWRDNHDHALPVLSALGLPATIFVVTDRIGTLGAFWPDEVSRRLAAAGRGAAARIAGQLGAQVTRDPLEGVLAVLKSLPQQELDETLAKLRACTPAGDESEREMLSWDELAALERAGIGIESHGATHAILTALQPDGIERELSRSRDALRAHGLGRCGLLAYPSGRRSAEARSLAVQVGYRAAFTTEHSLAPLDCDPMGIPRVGLHDDVSRTASEFRFALGTAAPQPAVAR
jgi:peptidoglycan/xylan/chitin deacetylase (PgdA/CDA1 family)